MATHQERILEFITAFPGRDDDEIASALKVAPRQTVNMVCRKLCTGSSSPMQNNYFLGVVGELLQRMHDNSAKHSIALPDLPKYRRLWSELPSSVKERLQLTALFITSDGMVREVLP